MMLTYWKWVDKYVLKYSVRKKLFSYLPIINNFIMLYKFNNNID